MGNRYRVLCVDDEIQILHSLERMLRLREFDVFTASGGHEGLKILSKEHIDVVISDHRMPEMNGSEFLKIVREKYPHTIRIMLTGYNDYESLLKAVREGEIFRFISKPWSMDELFEVIDSALCQNKA